MLIALVAFPAITQVAVRRCPTHTLTTWLLPGVVRRTDQCLKVSGGSDTVGRRAPPGEDDD
jgi:hypothetical protein